MSLHIDALPHQIAPKVLLPGDPLRAKHIAETYLTDYICINNNRGMLGYTGKYKNIDITVIGSGMGQASLGIYVNELINDYQVKQIIRVGTCGSYQANIGLKDIVLAQSASTDAQHNKINFNGLDFSACASFNLLSKAHSLLLKRNIIPHTGNILSSDSFYPFDKESNTWMKWAKYNVLAVEMESNALYTLGALYNVDTLSILTVSDSLVTHESTTKEERQITFNTMVLIALETLL